MRIRPRLGGVSRLAVPLLVFSLGCTTAVRADDWQPVNPQDLALKSEPKAPGATAIYLYRQVDRSDDAHYEIVYKRIKVLTDEGRDYGNVRIEYLKGSEQIGAIQARTIQPDGRIVNFSGTVYDKPVIEVRAAKMMAKTFSLPEVQAGSIVEYRYRRSLPDGYIYNSQWLLSDDLYTRSAKFSLEAYRGFALRYSWPMGLPDGTERPRARDSRIRLETHDVAAFVSEDHMPPAEQLKMRVDFIYDDSGLSLDDAVKFWRGYGKQRNHEVEKFVDEKRTLDKALAEIVAPGDTPEQKLHKIYDRVGAIRNTSFEREKSRQELDRAQEKEAHNVADVWNRGYGDGVSVAWLFLALARSAGFEADAVLVPTRNKYFFDKNLEAPNQLNSNVVRVKLNGEYLFLDPGTPSTPFGLLPWHETGVPGLKLDKNGGEWVNTPSPATATSQVQRTADFKLTRTGSLEGKLTVTYSGLEALSRRLDELNEDETDRREYLEDEVKASIPSGADVTLVEAPAWDGSSPSMKAVFDVRIGGWAAVAGQRALLPVGVFVSQEKRAFQHATRLNPIYYAYRYGTADSISIELPAGWHAATVPGPQAQTPTFAGYELKVEDQGTTLHIARNFSIGFILMLPKYYPNIQDFYGKVRSADEAQVVVMAPKSVATN